GIAARGPLPLIEGNYIGVDVSKIVNISNGGNGVQFSDGFLSGKIQKNFIGFNGGSGVRIPFAQVGQQESIGDAIVGNAIYSNGGLSVDLGTEGPNPNDFKDPDTGPNNLQNFPDLMSSRANVRASGGLAPAGSGSVTITGRFNSTPNSSFQLEFFFGAGCA